MEPLAVLVAILVPLLVGAAIVALAGIPLRADLFAAAGYSYVAGTLATGLVLVAWLFAGLPLSAWALNAALLFLGGILAVLASLRRRPAHARHVPLPAWDRAPSWQKGVFVLTVLILVVLACDRALLASGTPVVGGDEAFIWSARSKVIFNSEGLNERFHREISDSTPGATDVVSHKDYPLLNSLLHLLVFIDAGRITVIENRFPIQAFGLAAILVAAAALRRIANPVVAAALLVMLESGPAADMAHGTGMADGMVALGLLCAIDCLVREEETGERAWALLGGLSMGFLAWSKHEGAMLAALMAAAVLAMRGSGAGSRVGRALAWLAPPVLIAVLTWAVNAEFGFRNDLVQTGGAAPWARFFEALPSRGADVARRFWSDYAASSLASHLLLFPMVLAFLHPSVRSRRSIVAAGVVVLAAIAVHLAIFVGTPNDPGSHWETAGVRVLSQLNPAVAIVVGALAGAVMTRGAPG